MSEEQTGAITKGKYRPEIDGLRAFAVIAVIINHFNKGILPGGYLGVDIFFVISGYVITSSLFRRPSKDFKDFISGFYERRIKRLVPALSVFVLITSIAICLFNPSPGTSLKTGLTSLFGLSNIFLYINSTDYFAQSTELNVFTHTWSLGVEEQFYILFPFLIWFSGFGRQTKNGTRNLFLIVGALTITSLIGFIYFYQTNQPAAYFLMPPRFWEMAAGCLIFVGFQKRASIEQSLERVPPLLVLALIVAVMYLPMAFATASTIAVVALSSILIASLKKQTAAFKVFTNPKVVYIGLISYSLYLWHWGVLSISRWTIGIHWWSVPIQVALMLGLAFASYRWIETPLRKGNWLGKRWKTLVVGVGSLVLLSSTLLIFYRPLKGSILYLGDRKYVKLLTRSRNYDRKLDAFKGENCHFADSEFDIKIALKNCFLKGMVLPQNFFFVGNSHSDHYRETHFKLNEDKGVGVFSVSISSCNFLGNIDNHCQGSQSLIEDFVLGSIKKGDIVVISNSGGVASMDQVNKINSFSQTVHKAGGKVVLIGTTPFFSISIEQCMPIWSRSAILPAECSISLDEVQTKRYREVNNYLSKEIIIYDPTHDVCHNEKCSMTDQHFNPMYVDSHHFTDYANKKYIFDGFISFLHYNSLL